MAESLRHITIQQGTKLLQLQQCKTCCSSFHCPFCTASIFKPTRLHKVKLHLKSHYKKAVVHEGFTIHRCGLGCRLSLHYHCVYCTTTVLRKDDFENHLQICKHKQHLASARNKLSTSTATVTSLLLQKGSLPTSAIVNVPAEDSPSTTSSAISAIANLNTKTVIPVAMETLSAINISSSRIRVRPIIKQNCPICNVLINKHNLRKHIDRKHTEQQIKDVNATSHLTSQCIDKTNGVFAVLKVAKGHSVPLHVQYKTWGENHRVLCESSECQTNMDLAQRSGLMSYQCKHIKSVTYCKSSAEQVSLTKEALTEMLRANWLDEETKKMCLALQELAESSSIPLSVHTTIGIQVTKKYVSVFEPSESHHSHLGRVMVVYNTQSNTWFCPCAKLQSWCLHKYIAQWHLFQTHRELFHPVFSAEGTRSEEQYEYSEMDVTDDITVYPPHGLELENMVDYIFQNKKIPAVLADSICVPSADTSYPRSIWPNESICQRCPDAVSLSGPTLITQRAKILTNWYIIEDVATYYKQCPLCGMFYRYQEWKDGLHNFNDDIILDLPLCLTLRNLLQVHTSVRRAVEFLQLMTGVEFPPADTVLQAYLHFEALTAHEYKYSCVSCGDHPPVVIMGLYRKPLQLSAKDIEEPPENFKGEVDLDRFWEAVSKEMIGRGFVASDAHNPFVVPPSLHFWAPWIGQNTRSSDTVLNTEFKKVHDLKSGSENLISEDQLKEELFKQKVGGLRQLCSDSGLDSTGSYSDLLHRLSNEMKSGNQTSEKILEKIWAASRSWGVIMCPCGIVYSLKSNLRAQSPHDFADLLLSWKHMPNIIIYEFARSLATHINLRAPEQVPEIFPFEGCLLEPTQANIDLAKSGKLKVSLPWLQSKTVADLHGHPVTGSSEHYVLYDQIHKRSQKDSQNVLSKLTLVPQLAGKVNGRVIEQLFSKMKKNSYFLNTSSASTHLFQMRNIIHHYNENKNNKVIERMGDICLVNVSGLFCNE